MKIDRDFHLMNDWQERRRRETPWDSIGVVTAFLSVVTLMLLGAI